MTYNHISHRSHSSLEMMEKTYGIDKSILRKTNSLVIETVGWDPGDTSSVSRPVPNVSASLRAKHYVQNVILIPKQTFKYIFVCFCAYTVIFSLFSIKVDLSWELIQDADRQALENLPTLAKDDTTLSFLSPKAAPYPPDNSVSHFSIKSWSSAQTSLQRADFVSRQWRCRQVSPDCAAVISSSAETEQRSRSNLVVNGSWARLHVSQGICTSVFTQQNQHIPCIFSLFYPRLDNLSFLWRRNLYLGGH